MFTAIETALNRSFVRYLFASLTVAAACLVEKLMLARISPDLPTYLVFYPAVMLVALLAGLWPGLLATGLAASLAAYWILPPEGFAIERAVDALGLAVFAFMGAAMSVVAELYRNARKKAAAYDREVALRASQEALRQSEQRLSAAAMAAEIGLWYWNAVTGEMIASDSWRSLFGVTPNAKITLQTWRKALHPQDRDRVLRTVMAALRKKRDYHCEYRALWPDGSVRWIVDRGRPFYNDSGQLMSLAGINVDITERKHGEETLASGATPANE